MLRQRTPRRAPSRLSGTPLVLPPPRTPSPGDAEPCPAVPRRSRPHSLPEASSYTNPAYFIFEGLPTAWALGTGEAPNTQAESPTGGQRRRSPLRARVPSPSPRGCLLSPPGVGRQKRPKSAILERDAPAMGDCSLTALHMATCLSQLDRLAPGRAGDSHKVLLRQTHSALEPPPRRSPGVPGRTTDARQHGQPGEVPPRGGGRAFGYRATDRRRWALLVPP